MNSQVLMDGHPDNHQVKCVVVGDTGVGKTRLICAKACGTTYSLLRLMHTHVPTVWAIDHYRNDRNIYDRSWCTIDGVRVSIQLWDTFGYHDKDRKFAYGKADVVLVCFSLVRPRSLRNVLHHWWPEICKNVCGAPIVLCGTQGDLRHLYREPDFLKLDKGPFFREIAPEDIIAPETGRNMSKQIYAHSYYETSVLIPYGIEDVFDNVMRAGLTYKREKHFWNVLSSSLKHVNKATAQKPYLPPKPPSPQVTIPDNTWLPDMLRLYDESMFADVILRSSDGYTFKCHKIILVAALPSLQDIFCRHDQQKFQYTGSKPVSRSSSSGSGWEGNLKLGQFKGHSQDTMRLLENDDMEINSAFEDNEHNTEHVLLLNHAIFHAIDSISTPMIVLLNDNISGAAFMHVLKFMYTWTLNLDKTSETWNKVHKLAERLRFSVLVSYMDNVGCGEAYVNTMVVNAAYMSHQERLKELGLKHGLFTDVMFDLDGGSITAHKSLLTVRSDMMASMFTNNFMESMAKVIEFPEVRRKIFLTLLKYLYSGRLVKMLIPDLMELITLTNQLCLPHAHALAQDMIISQLTTLLASSQELFEEAASLLEPAQLHNASAVAEWCLWYLSCNYLEFYRKHNKLKQSLSPDNQIHLSNNRWPPIWYLKELDYYERCQVDYIRSQEEVHQRSYLCRRGSTDSEEGGCLRFCTRKNRRIKYNTTTGESACV